jgi:hypothetical protein
MDKKFFVAWLVILVVWFLGSGLVHGLLLKQDYMGLPFLFRAEEDARPYFYLMIIAHVLMSGAFTWIYARGIEYKDWLGQGIRYGVAVSLLAVVPTYMIYFVVQPTPSNLTIKQIIFDSILVILLGVIVSFLYRERAAKT